MVTDAILNAVYAAVNALLALIPSVNFEWTATGFGTLLTTANQFFPLSEIFAVFRSLLTAAVALAGVWAFMKVVDWLPFT